MSTVVMVRSYIIRIIVILETRSEMYI